MDGILFPTTATTPRRDRLVAQVGAAVVAAAQMMHADPHPEAEYTELLQLCWLAANDPQWIAARNKKRAAVALGRARKGLPGGVGYADFNTEDPREIARAVRNELREERRAKAGGKKATTFVQFDDARGYSGVVAEGRRPSRDIAEAFGERP